MTPAELEVALVYVVALVAASCALGCLMALATWSLSRPSGVRIRWRTK
jgi:hypothetical protein